MKYTKLTIALFAIVALAGCSSLASTPEPVAVAAPAPVETITPIVLDETMGRIAIGTLLDKLVNDGGCTIDKIIYREVKRGGHVEVNCKTTNDLALDTDL